MRASYQTFLLSGRARLKPKFVKPVAQALDLDETWLFCVALEGMQQPHDLPYISEFLWRMYASLEEAKLRDEVQPQGGEPHEEQKKTRKGKKGKKGKKRKKKAD